MRFLQEWAGISVLTWVIGMIVFIWLSGSLGWVFSTPEYARMPMAWALALTSPIEALVLELILWAGRQGPKFRCRHYPPKGHVWAEGTVCQVCGEDVSGLAYNQGEGI